ncbi:MAG TPA: hypothetical protein VM597_02700 [Gemmataceae bacterium]|nr:hypothetical protein [Gemmataceae bacterium]
MSYKLRVPPKVVRLTNKLAQAFADMRAAHVDRALKERRVEIYRRIHEAGLMRPLTWAIAYCPEAEEPEAPIRVNGKHTSILYASMDSSKLDGHYVTVEEYDCETLADVAKLYGSFDSGIGTRTIQEVNNSFARVVPELAGASKHVVDLLVGALNFYPESSTGMIIDPAKRGTPQDRAEALLDNVEFAAWFTGRFPINEDSRPLMRVPVVAAMWKTWLRSRPAAAEFWTAVRDQTGDGKHLAHRRLATFLITTRMRKSADMEARERRIKYTPREYYCKSVIAWNAWRKGGPAPELRYVADAPTPEPK